MATRQHKAFPEFLTQRLILREITRQDAHDLYEYYHDREVTKYLDWFGPHSATHAEEIINRWADGFHEDVFMRWGIALKGENKIIGTILLHPVRGPFEWKLPLVTGYELSRHYWNRGIMTEALEAILGYAFGSLGNHRVTAEVFLENKTSLRLLEKLGFQQEGLLRQHIWHEGYETWNDCYTLARLREQD